MTKTRSYINDVMGEGVKDFVTTVLKLIHRKTDDLFLSKFLLSQFISVCRIFSVTMCKVLFFTYGYEFFY